MSTEHCKDLLSEHYTWMLGTSFEVRVSEQKKILARLLEPLNDTPEGPLAVDLGGGPGFETIALAELGFSPVIAVDTSSELLDELRSHAHNLPVRITKADLRELPEFVQAGQATAIVCMGDTVIHLPDKRDVNALFRGVFNRLRPGGMFVITYRDLTTELHGTDRFIPVRSDQNKIMTCFLEFAYAESVTVHDLVYVRQVTGWSLNKSSYRKLRLGVDWMREELGNAGFISISQDACGRLMGFAARKPL